MLKPPKGLKKSKNPRRDALQDGRSQDGRSHRKASLKGKVGAGGASASKSRADEYVFVGGKRQKVSATKKGSYTQGSRNFRESAHAPVGYAQGKTSGERRPSRTGYGRLGQDKTGPARGEGRRALAEALDASVPITSVLVAKSLNFDDELARLLQRAVRRGITVTEVSKDRLDSMSAHGSHQGVIFEVPPFDYASLPEVLQGITGLKNALIIVCDHITDEGNLGAIIRSAEVVGAACVVIPSRRSARVGIGAYKTSAGACMHLPIVEVPNISAALKELKAAEFWVAGASEHADADLWSQRLAGRLCLVMGSEGEGISQLVLKHCDFLVKLPQAGKIESLNVAQAATALSYEWLRQVRMTEGDR